ncbi:MAG: GNAT family N-acetyltransferase [Flavisolibacter sp.]
MIIDTTLLRGRYVYLENLEAAHVPVLRKLARDERIWEYTKTLLVNEQYDNQFDQYIAAALDPRNTGGQASFVIRRTADQALIGMTRYYAIEPFHKRLSIGYTWYVPEVWGGAENKECKWLLLQYAFEQLGYQRVQFDVAHQNLRSQKAVEKIGGVKEAVLRKHGLHADGTVRDTVVFSIIDEEWPAKKEALLHLIPTGK